MELIKVPIGYLLDWIYQLVGNYGGALILFTLAIKLILLPLGLKQQKSMIKMQKLQPQIAALQEKYKNDKNTLSQETMKLYKEHDASPMGGCLPLLIQLPILFALYRVIYKPLTYMCHMGTEAIEKLASSVNFELTGTIMEQIDLAKLADKVNFDFLSLDLSVTPSLSDWKTLIIPVLAGVTTYLSSKVTMWMNKKDKKEDEAPKKKERILSPEQKPSSQNGNSAEGMTKSMTTFMPLFTVWITYTLPMAMGVYWVASNVFSILQTVLLNGYYANKFEGELEIANEKKLLKQERLHGKRKNGRNK